LREARWSSRDGLYETLAREPAECLVWPREAAARRSVAIGRAAFRAPLLLGGQAARAGMSCASCHRSGRGNPHFLFPALSGAPGTADVTSSLMSSHRGDGTANPKPIPDLALSPPKVSRAPGDGALKRFIRGLIVEEFDGPEPAPAVLAGLADYVRALQPAACRGTGHRVRLAERLDEAEQAVALAADADPATGRLLLAAARSTFGAVDERFRVPGLERSRALLRQADAELGAIRSGSGGLRAWQRRWPDRRRLLLRDEPRSLFAPAVLRRALAKAD
ncbi:MAG TPA: hypothetical protein VF727_05050, partial [Allosphingosinicella sp.]